MIHTILYYGHYDRNFRTWAPDTSMYVDRDGAKKPVEEASGKVGGYRFRYMECRDREFVAVGVDEIILRAPILLIPERHTGGKGLFNAPQFDDDSAMRLLADMIIANPERRDAFARLIRRLGK